MDKIVRLIRMILVLFFTIWIVIFLSMRAYKKDNIGEHTDFLSSTMISLYEIPYQIKEYFKGPEQALKIDHTHDLSEVGKISKSGLFLNNVFLLYSKLIDKDSIIVFLENIKNGEVALKWRVPTDIILTDLDSIRTDLIQRENTRRGPINLKNWVANGSNNLIVRHPLMLADSSLIFKIQDVGLIYKIDKNSNLLWKSKKLAHHSIELDENNNIWVGSISLENELANSYKFRDDALFCLDLRGREVYYKSLTEIFKENGLFGDLIESSPPNILSKIIDPYHLNDIEPVKSDSPYWKKGDVFISLRHKSLVFLFRPKTGKIVWYKQGPWLGQHDIVIENEHMISLFNNNISFLNDKINGTSNLATYDFKTDSVKFYANGIFSSNTEGRQTRLNNGESLVESTNEGIYYVLDSLGVLKAKFFIPFEKKENYAQYPGWSRPYFKKEGIFFHSSN